MNAVPHWPMQSGTFHFRLRTNVLSIIMAVHCWTILTSNRSLLCTLSFAQMYPQRTQMNIHFLWKVLLQYKTNKWYNTFRMHDTRCNFTLVKTKISSAIPNTIMKSRALSAITQSNNEKIVLQPKYVIKIFHLRNTFRYFLKIVLAVGVCACGVRVRRRTQFVVLFKMNGKSFVSHLLEHVSLLPSHSMHL